MVLSLHPSLFFRSRRAVGCACERARFNARLGVQANGAAPRSRGRDRRVQGPRSSGARAAATPGGHGSSAAASTSRPQQVLVHARGRTLLSISRAKIATDTAQTMRRRASSAPSAAGGSLLRSWARPGGSATVARAVSWPRPLCTLWVGGPEVLTAPRACALVAGYSVLARTSGLRR